MIKLTSGLDHWLYKNHPDIAVLIGFGHIELFTPEIRAAYINWCKTGEGKRYLEHWQ